MPLFCLDPPEQFVRIDNKGTAYKAQNWIKV